MRNKKTYLIAVLAMIIISLNWWLVANNQADRNTYENHFTTPDDLSPANKQMELVVHLQDKEAAVAYDCGITYSKIIMVPETTTVADASLRYLFAEELAPYGEFKSVTLSGGVAKIVIDNEDDPAGYKLSSLSSCQSRHLFAVLIDTLTQYDTIDSVELYSPNRKIEF